MCDCEMPQAFSLTWRTARKSHRCCECAGWITPGSRYQYVSGIWDNRPDSYRTCVECAQVRDWIISQLTGWDCAPCFTLLYDDMPREELPPHYVAAQAALRAEQAREAA